MSRFLRVRSLGREVDEVESRLRYGGAGAEPTQSAEDPLGRDLSTSIASGLPQVRFGLQALYRPLSRVSSVVRSDVSSYEDHRLFTPAEKALRSTRRVSQIVTHRPKAGSRRASQLPWALSFKDPTHAIICVKRKMRREVLMAKGKGGANSRPRRRSTSNIWC